MCRSFSSGRLGASAGSGQPVTQWYETGGQPMDISANLRQQTTRRTFLGLTAGLAGVAAVGTGHRRTRAAEGGTTLLSVGIAAIPSDRFAWRLVRDTAPEFGSGEELERALGFVYSPDGPVRLTSEVEGGSGLVFAGKAAFIPEAIVQRQESAEAEPVSYLRVGLVSPEDAGFGA